MVKHAGDLARCLAGGLLCLVGAVLMAPGYALAVFGTWMLPVRQVSIDTVVPGELSVDREPPQGLDLSRVPRWPAPARILSLDPRARARTWNGQAPLGPIVNPDDPNNGSPHRG